MKPADLILNSLYAGKIHDILMSADFFPKLIFLKSFSGIHVPSADQDQAQHFVSSGSKLFVQRLSLDIISGAKVRI